MSNLKKISIYIGLCFVVWSCAPAEEIAAYLEGSWEGEDDRYKWCVTYAKQEGTFFAEMYSLEKDKQPPLAIHFQGDLIVKRGKRFDLRLAKTHSKLGEEIPEGERYKLPLAYVIDNMKEDSFSYESVESEKKFNNFRIDNCSAYEEAFAAYLELQQSNPSLVEG